MAATNEQVQRFGDERYRPWSEQFRAVLLNAEDHRTSIDDVYAALNVESPTWTDDRTDGPPHLLTPSDVLAWNAFMADFVAFARGHAQLPIVLKACVRNPVE